MVVPLVPLALGGMAVSGLSNIYRGVNSGLAYNQFARGYKALDRGYRDYLSRNGRKINPNRALTSYYGQYLRSKIGSENSYMASVGSAGGTFGASTMLTRTHKWL